MATVWPASEPRTEEEAMKEIDGMLEEMKRLNAEIQDEQRAIDRVKRESRMLTEDIETILSRIGSRLDSLASLVNLPC